MTELDQIIQTLRRGGSIIYPTDTIWGLGCDATNSKAIDKLHQLKQRPREQPFTILVHELDMLKKFVPEVHPRIETLLIYHQRPLTVIYENVQNLPEVLTSDHGTAAIRVTHDPFCQMVIAQLGRPIVATSASLSQQPFPAHFGSIDYQLLRQVDYVVKYKQDLKDFEDPSVIARLTDRAELEFIRT